ncbi:GQ67_01199T0 [Komagataella phaffii]|nr:GQ67_01199T0 [Komagataella phaffii]
MYLMFLINVNIPNMEFFYCPETNTNSYYRLSFIKVKNEEDIKLHLCNINTVMNPYYFVLRNGKEVVLKTKNMAFCREYALGEYESMEEYMDNIEISNTTPEEATYPKDPPVEYQNEKKLRIYNQSEEKKIDLDFLSYFEAKSKKEAYMKELNQDHLNDGTFLYIENDKSYIMCVNKTVDWEIEVGWSRYLLHTMFETYGIFEEIYENFKV